MVSLGLLFLQGCLSRSNESNEKSPEPPRASEITVTSEPDLGNCSFIRKISVSGDSYAQLKQTLGSVLNGTPENPGLIDVVQSAAIGKSPSLATPVLTVASGVWIERNHSLFDQLAPYQLQPHVEECKEKLSSSAGQKICSSTQGQYRSSPDFYPNVRVVSEEITRNPTATSIDYYLYDIHVELCGYFGEHKGVAVIQKPTLEDCMSGTTVLNRHLH